MSKNNPDIQKFLDAAKTEVSENAADDSIISFEEFWAEKYSANDSDFSEHAFLSDVSMLLAHNQIGYYKELSSYKKGISALVLPVKKVIRKVVAFLFLPLVAEQNEVNLSMVRIITHMRSYVNQSKEKEKLMEKQIGELTEQVAQLTARLDAMEKGDRK